MRGVRESEVYSAGIDTECGNILVGWDGLSSGSLSLQRRCVRLDCMRHLRDLQMVRYYREGVCIGQLAVGFGERYNRERPRLMYNTPPPPPAKL